MIMKHECCNVFFIQKKETSDLNSSVLLKVFVLAKNPFQPENGVFFFFTWMIKRFTCVLLLYLAPEGNML